MQLIIIIRTTVLCSYLTLPYLRGGWVLATQRWGHNRIGPMRIPEITARLLEPLWGSNEPHKSMWLNTAKFIWLQEIGSEDRMSSHDSGRTLSQKVYGSFVFFATCWADWICSNFHDRSMHLFTTLEVKSMCVPRPGSAAPYTVIS